MSQVLRLLQTYLEDNFYWT